MKQEQEFILIDWFNVTSSAETKIIEDSKAVSIPRNGSATVVWTRSLPKSQNISINTGLKFSVEPYYSSKVYLLGFDWRLKQGSGRDCAVWIKFNSDVFLMLYMCGSEGTPVIKHLLNSSRLSLCRL